MNSHRFLSLITICLILVPLSGCSKIAHLDQLLRLKGYSDNKDQQEDFVKSQNQNFEKLLTAVRQNDVARYQDKRGVLKAFGTPVFSRYLVINGRSYEVWLYRYTTQFFGSEKVYLYFDLKGKLHSYDYTPGGRITRIK